ncbi:hypothetical protein GTP41_20850 [Pseudoduganella sp. DS3]|uniref:Uncharacterized protein n=1 Tax=Pseudoduganella guangdongensis TaxID=2692179 RepID=A0A6N9HPF1_9BURK|nr:hypothetical protein [Pseudoduganella guangdongensis]MYN04545.1 hypothetical protein [Pseudoduganella guangdongensis]
MKIELLDPVYMGDTDYEFALNPNVNWFSSDTAKIVVDPKTSLLKSVTVTSKDETLDVIKNAVAFAVAEAAPIPPTSVIQILIDPATFNSKQKQPLENQVNQALARFFAEACKDPKNPQLPECNQYRPGAADNFSISVSPVVGSRTLKSSGITDLTACDIGICHRGTIPYEIHATLLGNSKVSLVNLPNGGPIMTLALDRAPFVQVKHTLTLQDGIVSEYERDRPSSALAFVKAPLDVVSTMADVVTKVIQLKIDTSKAEVSLLEQDLAEVKRRKEIAEALEALSKKESALLGGQAGRLLVMTIGDPATPSVPDFNGTPPGAVQPVVDAKPDNQKPAQGKKPLKNPSNDGQIGAKNGLPEKKQ